MFNSSCSSNCKTHMCATSSVVQTSCPEALTLACPYFDQCAFEYFSTCARHKLKRFSGGSPSQTSVPPRPGMQDPAMAGDHLFLFQDRRLLSPILYCEHIASKAKHTPNVTLPPPTTRNANPMNGFAPPNQDAVLRTTFFCPSNVYVLYLQARRHGLRSVSLETKIIQTAAVSNNEQVP